MQEAVQKAIARALEGTAGIDFVLHRESWIIVAGEGRVPRLEKARYFSFMNRRRMWQEGQGDRVDLIVMDPETESEVRRYIREVLRLRAFKPGAEDSRDILEAWA